MRELNIVHSDFVSEVDRINIFHSKNQQALEAYLAHRETLLSLEIQVAMFLFRKSSGWPTLP